MLDRFLRSTREVVARAERLARAYGAPEVGSEHLLLALVESPRHGRLPPWCGATWGLSPEAVRAAIEQESADAKALETLGISLAEVRLAVERELGPDAWDRVDPPRRRLRFSPEAKDALERALREAAALRHRRLLPQHLLLGLLAQNGRACRVLIELGVDPGRLRRDVAATLSFRPLSLGLRR